MDKFTEEMINCIRNINPDNGEIARNTISDISGILEITDEEINRIVASAMGICLLKYSIKGDFTAIDSLFDEIGILITGTNLYLGMRKDHIKFKNAENTE